MTKPAPEPREICRECGNPIPPEALVDYGDGFTVCRGCEDAVADEWKETKAALIADGHKIPCDWIEEQI